MAFKVKARVLLELGSELISSDGIALYELIKNAIDANSKRVDIKVFVTLLHSDYLSLLDKIESMHLASLEAGNLKMEQSAVAKVMAEIKTSIVQDADEKLKSKFFEIIGSPSDLDQLRDKLGEAYLETSLIRIKDTGHGMTLEDLDLCFLTIGTQHRYQQRRAKKKALILGEKGVGRLSSMRLGSKLSVRSGTLKDDFWNMLYINWDMFTHESEKNIEEIDLEPHKGQEKGQGEKGTTLIIKGLHMNWSAKKLEETASAELSKLSDPFSNKKRFPVGLWFNNERIQVPFFQTKYLSMAHAKCTATYTPCNELGEAELSYTIDYFYRDKHMSDVIKEVELLSAIEPHPQITLHRLGKFSTDIYWYNRLQLKKSTIKDPLELKATKDFVRNWGGGLMLFRDGFRVNPYGSKDDDWLSLDPGAFRAGGYKVNRSQIVGRVEITSVENPALIDQTNREGLSSCPEKDSFVEILRGLLAGKFRGYLNNVDKAEKSRDIQDLQELEANLNEKEKKLLDNVRKLSSKYPEAGKITLQVEDIIQEIHQIIQAAEAMKATVEDEFDKYVHLAGLGLMVEIVSHELTRATQHALGTVSESLTKNLPDDLVSTFNNLEAQLKTLDKRLRTLDPLSISGRQTKSSFDLIKLIGDTLQDHQTQFGRHDVQTSVNVVGEPTPKPIILRAVKGMFIQILENLISNSIYWIKLEKKLNPQFSPSINIEIDRSKQKIQLTDNGPGVSPGRRELIFEAFETSKKAGKGKGLGLYISRQIAKYHGVEVFLSDKTTTHKERLNTFVISYETLEK